MLLRYVILIHAQAQTKAQGWKVVHYFWWWCTYTYVCNVRTYKTKQTDLRVKPLFKLVLWLVLGRGSLYDSSLVLFYTCRKTFRTLRGVWGFQCSLRSPHIQHVVSDDEELLQWVHVFGRSHSACVATYFKSDTLSYKRQNCHFTKLI